MNSNLPPRTRAGRLQWFRSGLVHRDYASVLKDIREPNAALNPDHLAYNFELTDGETLTGIVQQETSEQITLATAPASRSLSSEAK